MSEEITKKKLLMKQQVDTINNNTGKSNTEKNDKTYSMKTIKGRINKNTINIITQNK